MLASAHRASARALRHLQERRLDDARWLVVILDGKTFASDSIVIALGVTLTGEKRLLGLVQTATENRRVCAAFLRELIERGLRFPEGVERPLVVLDGGKGLRAAAREVFGDAVPIQRCQWHKRENVVSYLSKHDQPVWRRKLQAAYAHPSYGDAKRALLRLVRELRVINDSAAGSLEEGLEETLTLHRLGVFPRTGNQLQDHEPLGERDGARGGEDVARRSLAHERSEVALVCGGVAGRRSAVPTRERLHQASLAGARAEDENNPHYRGRCVSIVPLKPPQIDDRLSVHVPALALYHQHKTSPTSEQPELQNLLPLTHSPETTT